MKTYPKILQGGMGVNISNWRLARAVSMLGQQGTVSGVILEVVVARQLQNGDCGGHIRRALSHFPFPDISKMVLDAFYVEGGISKGTPFKHVPALSIMPSNLLVSLIVCANFAFVWLAKEDHENPVSINYLEKIAMPHIYAITGAMLANVDFITMGAGIALQIPGVINAIAESKVASYRVPVIGQNSTHYTMGFDPLKFFGDKLPITKKPRFLPIISSDFLARYFIKKAPEKSVDGFVVEEDIAGGHNAPPRKPVLNEKGEVEPIYGPADKVNYPKIAELGLPFWIGGGYTSPEKMEWALSVGASGIQAGSIFAFCEQSAMDPEIRKKLCRLGFNGELKVKTDMRISPTGFPFKVAVVDGTLSEKEVYDRRVRSCKHGALVSLYEEKDGSIGYRCSGEPVESFVKKGGDAKDTIGRGCLCCGLLSTAGLNNEGEPPIITLGDDHSFIPKIMATADSSYSAKDAIDYILGNKH